jgi:hypothetical protein
MAEAVAKFSVAIAISVERGTTSPQVWATKTGKADPSPR